MKTATFRWLLPLFFFMGLSKMTAQINPIVVPKSYENTIDTVKQFFKGDLILIEPDSVYVLNQMQLSHYRLLLKFKVAVNQDNTNIERIFNELVDSVTLNLAKLDDLNKRMKINADSTSAIGQRLADVTYRNALRADSTLILANIKLTDAKNRLDTADAHLVLANKYIAKERKERWWRSVKWAGVGVIVGILIRSFVIKKP